MNTPKNATDLWWNADTVQEIEKAITGAMCFYNHHCFLNWVETWRETESSQAVGVANLAKISEDLARSAYDKLSARAAMYAALAASNPNRTIALKFAKLAQDYVKRAADAKPPEPNP